MLTGLRVRNFKSWKDSGDIRLAPITLLFGTNSSGKTSLIQLLLLLKQTAESSDRRRVLDLGDANSLVELGTFKDLIHNHRADSELFFTVEWKTADQFWLEQIFPENFDRLDFSASILQDATPGIAVKEFHYNVGQQHLFARRDEIGGQYHAGHYYNSETQGLGEPTKFYVFPEDPHRSAPESEMYSQLAFELQTTLSRISYVGPMREDPKRNYLWTGAKPSNVGKRGERAVEALLAAQITGRTVPAGTEAGDDGEPLPQRVGRWLRDMGVIHSFELRELVAGRQIFELVVRMRPDSPEVLLTDVGFGVSQVLPVLVQSYYAETDNTVIFEQPEIHLHPGVQSHLADVFIDATRTRGVQFLIESHSEHLLRRLQRRLAEGVITAEDVALYFVEYGPEGSQLRALELDETGNIKNWPASICYRTSSPTVG
ncbi:DUF3696 domain-containing protein [Frankia sp. Cas4]|uniref:DUF3696 domain-containing protein n=1 Tax=Frankia sp. Cas4 TaxID=3073927 RepID=UPI002AD4164F|nr:DUF3696 domain-containing protein [Frankia sp. Cas4]